MKCMGKVNIRDCRADCCGLVSLHKNFIKKHKTKMRKGAILVTELSDNREIWVKDGNCAFLSKHFKCLVYEDRPYVCRLMGSGESKHPFMRCHHLGQITTEELETFLQHKSTGMITPEDWAEHYRLEKLDIDLDK